MKKIFYLILVFIPVPLYAYEKDDLNCSARINITNLISDTTLNKNLMNIFGESSFLKDIKPNTESLEINLYTNNFTLMDVAQLIELVNIGTVVLENNSEKIKDKKLKIIKYPICMDDIFKLASYRFKEQEICYRETHELGSLTVALFHELVHSDDEVSHRINEKVNNLNRKYEESDKKSNVNDLKNRIDELSCRIDFISERMAYTAEFEFTSKFKEIFPCFEKYMNEAVKRVSGFPKTGYSIILKENNHVTNYPECLEKNYIYKELLNLENKDYFEQKKIVKELYDSGRL